MSILTRQISKYLEYCQYQKRLDEKTLKAYRIDLRQMISDNEIRSRSFNELINTSI